MRTDDIVKKIVFCANVSRGLTDHPPDRSRRHACVRRPFFAISLDTVTEKASDARITVDTWPLSVTESFGLPPQRKAVSMSGTKKFDLREWLVPPILVPLVFGLMVAGAVVIRW